MSSFVNLIKQIQKLVDVKIDGVIGHKTLNAILSKLLQYQNNESPEHRAVGRDDTKKKLAGTNKDPYPEVFKPSPNQSKTIDPKFICLHHSDGSYEGGVDWILQEKSRVSYHYLIDSDGSRTQFVYDHRRAWHAGKSHWKADGREYTAMNGWSIGVAFWGDTYKRVVSKEEIDSAAHKCIYLMDKFNIPIHHIVTHRMIAPERKTDCSPETFEAVIHRIEEIQHEESW